MMHGTPTVETGFVLPTDLTMTIRRCILPIAGRAPVGKIEKLSHGIWWLRGAVPMHRDNQPPNTITTGLIIVNDCHATLAAAGQQFAIPPGSVYRIDSREPHGTLALEQESAERLFVFLAWDCHFLDLKPIKQFAMEACDELSWFTRPWRPTPPDRVDDVYNREIAA